MNKNTLIAVLGLAVVVLLVFVLTRGCPPPPPPPPPPPGYTNVMSVTVIDGITNEVAEVVPIVRSVERRPLEPEATKRLHDGPVVVTSLFEASGRAEHGNYGKLIRGSYLYTITVQAKSEIASKEENETTGSVRVVEKRTFTQAKDNLGLSDLDVAIDLETLPVGQVESFVNGAVNVIGGIVTLVTKGAALPGVAKVKAGVATAFAALHAVDGASARGMLGAFGVDVPENLEVFVNKRIDQLVARQLKEVKVALQSIEGKTYIITYVQAANGMPLNVDFTHDGGEPITEAEWEILRSANAFLDANVVRDTRCRVGQTWDIWADEAQELFGAAGEGRAEGKVSVTRVDDQEDGTWTLKIEPSEVFFRNDAGTAAGRMQVKDGNGLVDAENASVKSLQATAEGDLRTLNKKRHCLLDFIKKFNSDANLRFTLSVEPTE